ncbi:hypothetical protein C8R21_108111 [Nitrosospira multiformis]|uniref:Uncharacterized protein n=1 Tax=Nitrosospira multiformis TaxID=1231 RepID=A0A2T5ID38_9PROT|nr:hypothetical protein [Nitrosospira multiformis]PTQ81733.1 hypothetical protein C8R21_108111 [Nitrosospira multiformis]
MSSALSTCLTSVISIAIPPALDDIAEFALKLLQLYVKELGVVACKRAECEVAIIGFCPVEHKLKMYYLTPSINQGELEYKLEKHPDDQGDDFVFLLGADKSRIRKNIEAFRRERLKDISWWRAPKNVISDEVENSDNPTIGGHLQLGICNQLGFQVYSVCRPYSLGGAAYLSYLGLNVSSDFGQIGSCRIGMPVCYDSSHYAKAQRGNPMRGNPMSSVQQN